VSTSDTPAPARGASTLWCVHVYGPDDLLACASRKDAVQNALWLNLSGYKQQNTNDEYMPMAWAVPEPWPGTREAHWEALNEQDRDDERWTGDETKLRLLAGEMFDFTEDGRPIDWHATVAAERNAAIQPILDLHAPVREQYFDAATGAPAGSAVECEYCSTQQGDGVDYPCATARAAGATR
jgi:hypothetical protein